MKRKDLTLALALVTFLGGCAYLGVLSGSCVAELLTPVEVKPELPIEEVMEEPQEPIDESELVVQDVLVKGWVHERVIVKNNLGKSPKAVRMTDYGEWVEGIAVVGTEWVEIPGGFIRSDYISDKKPIYEEFLAPSTSGFKSFMGYTYFGEEYPQYKLQRSAVTDDLGFRKVNGRYCVAVGSHFTENIGQYFDLVLENGVTIPCILADSKADKDTDDRQIVTTHNGCMSEFIVDEDSLDENIMRMGDVSYAYDEWDASVLYVRVYDKNYFEEVS